jgi:hypothetical protein
VSAHDIFETLLADYFDTEPRTTRLLTDEVDNVITFVTEVYGEGERTAVDGFRRFLCARAQKSTRGRLLGAKTVEIREAILDLQDVYEQMTVRQVFYQLASVQKIVPKDEGAGYVRVQRQVLELRRQGFLPWAFIADGTRWRRQPGTWDSVEDVLRETARQYRRNLWRSQGVRIEVWLEKDALASVLDPTTYGWGVSLMVSRGQSSDTYIYEAAQEAKAAWDRASIETVVYALYDSDLSGRRAVAAIERKLAAYSDDAPISFSLLAVTGDQIRDWKLPTRPAKDEDGRDVVELDAIPPERLIALVEDAITSHIDADAWEKERATEASERAILERIVGAA